MYSVEIDLNRKAECRWEVIEQYKEEAKLLVDYYISEIRDYSSLYKLPLHAYSNIYIKDEFRRELRGMSKVLNIPYSDLLLVNLFYDLLKLILSPSQLLFGCSGFVVDRTGGPVHARNMDWDSDGYSMKAFSLHQKFVKDGECVFEAIGWPGYNACISGMASGRFSLTLNAVSSKKSVALKTPVTYLLRDVLQNTESWEAAKCQLEAVPVFSDCLLLLSGTKQGEVVVIERTPKEYQTRFSGEDYIVVTNDYRTKLADHQEGMDGILAETTCYRYKRIEQLLMDQLPETDDDYFRILNDPSVKMSITVQQMLMQASSGRLVSF